MHEMDLGPLMEELAVHVDDSNKQWNASSKEVNHLRR
jgi:hypothetical protein